MALDNDKDLELNLDDKIHKTLSSRLGRGDFNDAIARAVEAAVAKHLTSQPKTAAQDVDVKVKDSRDDEIAKLRQEMADKEAKSLAKIVAQQEKQAMAALKSELKGKVIPDMDDVVAEWMFTSKKMVSINEEGDAMLKVGDESYPISEGVSKFLKSKDAKRFVPAGEVNRAVVKPVLDRPAPSGLPISSVDSSGSENSVTQDILAKLNAS